ncbi:MAG: hypothetical protein GY869_21740 [Planctomycetes bacterium]|nr:hypothetical protein [Planctomycetota bacterium]
MNTQSINTLLTVAVVLVAGGGLGLAGVMFFTDSPGNQDLATSVEPLDPIPSVEETVLPKLAEKDSGDLVVSEPPGDCLAIMGDEAQFGKTWVKAGDMLGDAQVLEVREAEVAFDWQGETIIRPLAEAVVTKSTSKKQAAAKKAAGVTLSTREGYNDVKDQIYLALEAGKLSQEDAMAKMNATVRQAVVDGGLPRIDARAELGEAREVIYK